LTTLINMGWLYLTDGTDIMKIACRKIRWKYIFDPTITHFIGGTSIGYDIGEKYLVITAQGLIFENTSDVETFIQYIDDWQHNGPFTLKIQKNGAGNFHKLDGVNTTYQVLVQKGIQDAYPVANGDATVMEIKSMIFEEAGTRST